MRLWTSFLPFLLLSGCAQSPPGPGDGATAGIELGGPYPGEPPGPLVSPAGRVIEPGTVDELGWVLPLDVRRPRPERERGTRPELGTWEPVAGTPFAETRLGPDDGHSQNETSIDAAGSTVVGGWNNLTDTTLLMGVARSGDAGASWSWDLIAGHDVMSDPAVKAAGAGRWYYGYLALGGPGGGDAEIFVRRSVDDGLTWQAPVAVTANTGFDDKPYLDARGDEVLVAWADFTFSPAKVRVARSLDGGLSFGGDTVLANNSVAGNVASPVIAPDGTYFVFWRDSFQEFLWMSVSTDQGTTWSPDVSIAAMNPLPSTMPGGFRMINGPSADAHPATGDLLVLWNDQLFGDPDVLAVRSGDGGATWSVPVRVNDDAGTAEQFFPWLDFDETGVAHAVWYDRRQQGFDIDVYISRSVDGGATWSPDLRITAASFTPLLPWDSSVPSIGDYNGIAAAAGKAYPFYQDARRGEQDVWVAVVPTLEPIFTDGFESGDASQWPVVQEEP